jgi:hypothetical protein
LLLPLLLLLLTSNMRLAERRPFNMRAAQETPGRHV